jgi:phytoene synthase
MAEDDDLDARVRQLDPDRWLASRFIADEEARADVIALYGLNIELSRAAEVASQPLVGEMRLAWWREAIEEIFEGRPVRRHPGALALAQAVRRRDLPRAGLEALVDARLRDLDAWPLAAGETEAYVDATAGGLMALAALSLSPGADPHAVRHAARAWGLAGLSRLERLPAAWDGAEIARRVEADLALARQELAALPVAAFPAVAYAALSGPLARGRPLSELGKRMRITWAVLRGRI